MVQNWATVAQAEGRTECSHWGLVDWGAPSECGGQPRPEARRPSRRDSHSCGTRRRFPTMSTADGLLGQGAGRARSRRSALVGCSRMPCEGGRSHARRACRAAISDGDRRCETDATKDLQHRCVL